MKKIKHLRWYIVAILMLVTTINYLDRFTLTMVVTSDVFKQEFHLTPLQYARIIMAFQLCYALMQPITGRLLDWLGTKRGFMLAVIWWSVAGMAHALARTPLTMGIFRGLLGVGEAANFPGANKTISEWFPPKERTVATGWMNIGSAMGATIAPFLVTWMILTWGWRSAFILTGLVGFLWVGLWLWFYQPPEKNPRITEEELKLIQEGIASEPPVSQADQSKGVWKLIFTTQAFWGLAIARFMSEPAWQFANNWIPKYFNDTRGIQIKELALFAAMTFIAADLGSIVGGYLSPWFMKAGFRLMNARRLAVTVGAVMMPAMLLIASTVNPFLALGFFCIATFAHQCISATLLTLPADLFPSRAVATANGMAGCCGYFGGALFTEITGRLANVGRYGTIFTIMGLLDLIGAAALWILIRNPKDKQQAS